MRRDKDFYDSQEYERMERLPKRDPTEPYYHRFARKAPQKAPERTSAKFYGPGHSDYDRQQEKPQLSVAAELISFSKQFALEAEKRKGALYHMVINSPEFKALKAQTLAMIAQRGNSQFVIDQHAKKILALAKTLGWKLVQSPSNVLKPPEAVT